MIRISETEAIVTDARGHATVVPAPHAHAELQAGDADTLASIIRQALESCATAHFEEGRYVTGGGAGRKATWHIMRDEDADPTARMWCAFHVYAGAVTQLREQLRELIDAYADRDADDLTGSDVVRLWEQLTTIAEQHFGDDPR